MEKQRLRKNHKDRLFILIGFVSILILFLLYSGMRDFSITSDSMQSIERLSIGFYGLLFLSFGAIGYGLYRYHQRKVVENQNYILSIIAKMTWNDKSRKIFVGTFIAYGMFFSLTSGLIVYQPEVMFSYHYDAIVPSAHINPCCGDPGYMPQIIVYVTEHIGLQIIPINLVLVMVVTYLVGLNTSLVISAISITKRSGGLSGLGAATGLFIACPTCASTFFTIFIGSASVVTFSMILLQLQTIFIGITIPVLLVTPIIIARKIQKQNDNCNLNANKT